MACSRTISSIVTIVASPASHTACAWVRPNLFASSLRRASVTIVKCALVCPVSVAAQRPRSSTMTRLPAFARRYAAVSPVIPPPTTTTSASASSASLANCGNVLDVDQYGVVSPFAVPMYASSSEGSLGVVALGEAAHKYRPMPRDAAIRQRCRRRRHRPPYHGPSRRADEQQQFAATKRQPVIIVAQGLL